MQSDLFGSLLTLLSLSLIILPTPRRRHRWQPAEATVLAAAAAGIPNRQRWPSRHTQRSYRRWYSRSHNAASCRLLFAPTAALLPFGIDAYGRRRQ